jgi:LPS export ABC transporter protein LptC
MNHYFLSILLLLLFTSCIVEEPDLSRYTDSTVENVEEARDIEVRYTDSSYLVLILKAPLSRKKIERYTMADEFPEGIDATFYDRSGKAKSWLTADYAIRDQLQRTVTVQKNVVLTNDQGERLEGPELIWDEKSKEIYTDRFVKIIRADSSVIYSYGFKSNEAFTRYELQAVSGDMTLEEE